MWFKTSQLGIGAANLVVTKLQPVQIYSCPIIFLI